MSYPDPANPYNPPSAFPTGGPPAGKPLAGMDYMRMITYIFENPNWMMNILLAALCALIPVIGGIVLQGYRYEVVIGLLATGGARYPDFDFGRFVDYLMRGLWPFLVALVCSFAFLPFVCLIVIAMSMGRAGEIIGLLVNLAMLVFVPVFALLLIPMVFRAAMTLDFAQAFQIEWIKDFLKRVWVELILGILFLMVASMVLAPLGLLACCVGILAVGPILMLAQGHLLFQVYSLYLARGGTPIQINYGSQPPPTR
jgi:hypothetical protein